MTKQLFVLLFLHFSVHAFAQDASEVNTDTVVCCNAKIVFNHRCCELLDGVSFVHVHENERTAANAAKWMVDSLKKGCFVTWEYKQQRFVDFTLNNTSYRFDPNRIYTPAGINATLKENGSYSNAAAMQVSNVAETFKEKYVKGFSMVVALHNNTDAGGLSVNSYKKGGRYSSDAKAVFINPEQDADDFFFTTETVFFSFLKSKGFNVVLQNNVAVTDDGSLSVFCGEEGIPYLNIEAQNGHLSTQISMLKTVLELISQRKNQQLANQY